MMGRHNEQALTVVKDHTTVYNDGAKQLSYLISVFLPLAFLPVDFAVSVGFGSCVFGVAVVLAGTENNINIV